MNFIPHPNGSFDLSCFGISLHRFQININQSFREKLENNKPTQALTLKILKQIKLKSDILSFLTKPVVFISLSVAVMTTGFVLPATGIVLVAIRTMSVVLGSRILDFFMRSNNDNFLSRVSEAYGKQSQQAATYITVLESCHDEFRKFIHIRSLKSL